MSFSQETQKKINQFAKEQSQYYLEEAEMTYMEKLRKKAARTKQKANAKLARFRSSSDQAREAHNDLLIYMSDYMNDLTLKGLSEEDAFEKAKEELSASDKCNLHADFHERIRQYYETRDPADYESVGLLYGGITIICMVVGSLTGYLTGGGRLEFLNGGWIDTLIGTGAGLLIGAGIGQICNAVSVRKK